MSWEKEEIATAIMMMNIDRSEIHFCILSITTNCNKASIYNGLRYAGNTDSRLLTYIIYNLYNYVYIHTERSKYVLRIFRTDRKTKSED